MKPIAVIYLPRNINDNNGQINPFELADGLNGRHSKYDFPIELYGDYLWWCFPSSDNEFHLEVFHPKDFTEIQYEELKQLLTTEINKINQQNEHN